MLNKELLTNFLTWYIKNNKMDVDSHHVNDTIEEYIDSFSIQFVPPPDLDTIYDDLSVKKHLIEWTNFVNKDKGVTGEDIWTTLEYLPQFSFKNLRMKFGDEVNDDFNGGEITVNYNFDDIKLNFE